MVGVFIDILFPIALLALMVGGVFVMRRNRFWGGVIVVLAAVEFYRQF